MSLGDVHRGITEKLAFQGGQKAQTNYQGLDFMMSILDDMGNRDSSQE